MDEERKAFCKNYGQCSKADSMEVFSFAADDPVICPECKRELVVQSSGQKDKIKKYSILISIFILITVVPWFVIDQFFTPGGTSVYLPVKPNELQKYFVGTVHLKNDQIKTAVLKIYKIEVTAEQTTYYYTMNINAVEGRMDSLGLVIAKENKLYSPDMGFLSYARADDNKIILKSADQYKKPYWSFEEAGQ